MYSDLLRTNRLAYLVLANVGSKKNFFPRGYNCGMPQIFLISMEILTKREKRLYCLIFVSFFYLKKGNFEAASLARSLLAILLTRTLDKMIRALKIQRLNRPKLELKSKSN